MYGSAIDFEYLGSELINAMDLLVGQFTQYNFLLTTIL